MINKKRKITSVDTQNFTLDFKDPSMCLKSLSPKNGAIFKARNSISSVLSAEKKSHQNAYKIFREMIKRRQLINLIKEEEFENV